MINIHAPNARYAAHELHHFLTGVVDVPILLESSGKADRTCTLVVKPEQVQEVIIFNDAALTTISARSESSLLHGVYYFLEHMGYVFTARGTIAPPSPVSWPAPFACEQTPPVSARGVRLHLNFPMDISCLPLDSAMDYVRNLARMKFNVLALHLYPNQGWLQLDYKGYRIGIDAATTLYYSERHAVCRDQTVRAQQRQQGNLVYPRIRAALPRA